MTFTVDVGSTACRSLAIFSGPAKAQLVVNKTKSASPTSRVPQAAPFDRRTAVDFCFLCPWRTIKILLTSLQTKRSIQNARMSCQDWYAVAMPTSKSGQLLVKMRLSKELCGDWDKMSRILRE